jgi:hypothetical protein
MPGALPFSVSSVSLPHIIAPTFRGGLLGDIFAVGGLLEKEVETFSCGRCRSVPLAWEADKSS